MSHKKQLQAQFSYNTTQVLWLTGLTPEAYEHFMADTAAAWAEQYAAKHCNPIALLSCNMFLSWWLHNWHVADDTFILPMLYETPLNRYTVYCMLHQYVFDTNDVKANWLLADFRNMLPYFLTTIKKTVCK